eukprot:3244248-Pyramimonas_sp.AAC.1
MVKALKKCGDLKGGGTVYVPRGRKFLMWPFAIPKSHITLWIDGTIICPGRLALWGPLEMLPKIGVYSLSPRVTGPPLQ